ncbi:MAG: hypothetical protein AB7T63_16205 [Planctomycetota bacterium]
MSGPERTPSSQRAGLLAVLALAVALPLCLLFVPGETLAQDECCATAGEATASVLAELGRVSRVVPPAPWLPWCDAQSGFAAAQPEDGEPLSLPTQSVLLRRAPNEARRL